MVTPHWHGTIDHIVFAAVTTAIVFHVARVGFAWMGSKGGTLGTIGKSGGAFFTFSGGA